MTIIYYYLFTIYECKKYYTLYSQHYLYYYNHLKINPLIYITMIAYFEFFQCMWCYIQYGQEDGALLFVLLEPEGRYNSPSQYLVVDPSNIEVVSVGGIDYNIIQLAENEVVGNRIGEIQDIGAAIYNGYYLQK